MVEAETRMVSSAEKLARSAEVCLAVAEIRGRKEMKRDKTQNIAEKQVSCYYMMIHEFVVNGEANQPSNEPTKMNLGLYY